MYLRQQNATRIGEHIVERTIRKRKVPNVNVFKGLHDTWYMYTMYAVLQ